MTYRTTSYIRYRITSEQTTPSSIIHYLTYDILKNLFLLMFRQLKTLLPVQIAPVTTQSGPHTLRLFCISSQKLMNMSPNAKQQKNEKFGHLPLSTSGPQETSLTVRMRHEISLKSPDTDVPSREMRSFERHTSTKARHSQKKNAIHSSSMAFFPLTFKLSMSRSSVHMRNTGLVRTTSPRTPS